jgi:hypothetical protein
MKTKIVIAVAALAVATMSFKTLSIDKTTATVEQMNGIYVYAFSKPVGKYDILGSVKVKGMVSNEKGPHMVDLLTGYAKKDYPSADAIIVNSEFEKAEVIKFKE